MNVISQSIGICIKRCFSTLVCECDVNKEQRLNIEIEVPAQLVLIY